LRNYIYKYKYISNI
jgi:hypothetical protein